MNSIRFFETLSAGRIAVLISDNGLLPFEQLIPYDRFVIRIAEQDVNHAPDLIANWISQKSDEDLIQRCREARKAWETLLAPERIIYPLQQVVMRQFEHSINKPFHAKTQRRKEDQVFQGAIAAAYLQQALTVYGSGDTAEAEQLLRKGMAADPSDAELIRCLALLLNETGRCEECIALLTPAEQRQPTIPALHRLLGEAYQQTGRWEFACQQFRLALEDEPDNAVLLMNSGIVCSRLDRHNEALVYLEKAAALEPASAPILMNLGCVLQSLSRIDEATTTLRTAVQLDPTYATTAWNLAQILLLQGDFVEGFALFEARFSKRDPVPRLQVATPLWQGENLAGKTVIITTEQAFGDAIQFVRYLPMLAQQGARVILYNHLPPLQQLFASVPGVTAVITSLSELPMADYQIPMLSLPRLFSTTSVNIPNRLIPYLAPSSQKQAFWRTKLTAAVGIKIGICWAGRQKPDPHRSATLFDFAPLRQLSSAVFYSLQLGEGSEQAATPPQGIRLIDFTGDIHDFEDTAALIGQLDLIISVDTSVAHLAGALGKPTFTLLPFAPDWRWMLQREDSPWYPTMRLFRQKKAADWKDPIQEILAFLTTI
jgi:Flp pilus assembly protein TadD